MNSGFFDKAELRRGELPNCGLCKLACRCNSSKIPVAGRCGSCSVLVVGEAPGEEEDKQGRLFVGPAGLYLRDVFESVGRDLDECWVTNAVICRPPKNVMSDVYLQACRPTLIRTIAELQPEVIIPLGEWALKSILPEVYQKFGGGMEKWRGWKIPYSGVNAWVCPTYHPNYILRAGDDPALGLLFRQDIESALGYGGLSREEYPTLSGLEKSVTIVRAEDEAFSRLEDLAAQEGILAFDYETTCLKPEIAGAEIVSCSFCLNGTDTWACLLPKSLYPALSKVLRSKRLEKVASNLKFEERWTRRILGHGVVGWLWDTMLAAHCLDNRTGISSVKFQALILLGIDPWDDAVEPYIRSGPRTQGLNRMKRAPVHEMLLYNGLDSLIEYHVMRMQQALMGVCVD